MKSKEFGAALALQHRGFSFSVYSQYCNLTTWIYGGIVYFADNDYAGDTEEYIAAQVHDKKKTVYSGYRKVTMLLFSNGNS